jgi:hypothetical protein
VDVSPEANNDLLVDEWARNAHLAAVKEMVALYASQQEEDRARAATEAEMREALFQLHRLVGATVEIVGANPLLLASALLIVKRRAIEATAVCISANYASWDDKQHAAEVTDVVEKKIAGCREILGESDFALLLKILDYESGGRKSLAEYDALWSEFDEAAGLIQREEDVSEARRQWELKRNFWMPNWFLGHMCRMSIVVALASLFLLAIGRILEELKVEVPILKPELKQGLREAAVAGFGFFLFLGLIRLMVGVHGRNIYGPPPPKSDWPTERMISSLPPGAVGRRYPRYAQLYRVLDESKAAMVAYDRRHGVASRAEIAEVMKAAESESDSLLKRYNVTSLPAWD